ncbi:MAG: ATP-binding protein, partial [bacterium]|nr:ATP-binding protein [bacterium]
RAVELIDETISQAHTLSQGLCPVEIEENGLAEALRGLWQQTNSTYDIRCLFDCDEEVSVISTDVATHLFRIAQEAVTNAVKHSLADTIRIRLQSLDNNIILAIEDNGTSFCETPTESQGMGISIMRHRAGFIGATFEIISKPEKGTVIVCTLSQF